MEEMNKEKVGGKWNRKRPRKTKGYNLSLWINLAHSLLSALCVAPVLGGSKRCHNPCIKPTLRTVPGIIQGNKEGEGRSNAIKPHIHVRNNIIKVDFPDKWIHSTVSYIGTKFLINNFNICSCILFVLTSDQLTKASNEQENRELIRSLLTTAVWKLLACITRSGVTHRQSSLV